MKKQPQIVSENRSLNPLTYPQFVSKELFKKLESEAEPISGIFGLKVKKALVLVVT